MAPPSRQDDGGTRAPAPCVRGLRGCASVCSRTCAVVVVLPSTLRVCPHPSSTDSLWRGRRATSQTPPVSPYALLHRRRCHPLGTDVSLASGSALRGNSSYRDCWFKHKLHFSRFVVHSTERGFYLVWTASVEPPRVPCSISGDGEICEVRRLFADGFVCEGLHCDPILCACWHDGSETVVLKTLRATLSGSCPDSTASNAVHSDSRLLQYENPRRFPHH